MEDQRKLADSKLDLALHKSFLAFETRSADSIEFSDDVSTYFKESTLGFKTRAAAGLIKSIFTDEVACEMNWDGADFGDLHLTTHFNNAIPDSPQDLHEFLITQMPVVAERFELVRKLGSGGMGSVFQAVDSERGTTLAIKFLRRPAPWMLLRFKQEFRLVNNLAHRNLVRFYEFFHHDHLSCFTMELIQGTDFIKWWNRKKNSANEKDPSASDFLDLKNALFQLAEGLNALHRDGKLHRDIKPANVMVSDLDDRVVLLDFGLVTNYAERVGLFNPDHIDVGGTIPFMAPELLEGSRAGVSCDWYAFGVMLYQVLSGKLPFTGTYLEITERKRRVDIAPLPSWVPQSIQSTCIELLSVNPEDRPDFAKIRNTLVNNSTGKEFDSVNLSPETGNSGNHLPFFEKTIARSKIAVGREAEISQLDRGMRECLKGIPTLTLIHGNSGMGKTCIIEHFQARLEKNPHQPFILSSRCYEQESMPYKGIDDVMDQISLFLINFRKEEIESFLPNDFQLLCDVFPVLRIVNDFCQLNPKPFDRNQVDLPSQRIRMLDAIQQLFANLASHKPLVLFLDDLQWCDKDCIKIIEAILRQRNNRIMVVGSYRREEARRNTYLLSLTNANHSDWSVFEIPVDELDRDSLRRMAEGILGNNENGFGIDTIIDESRGIPFFLIQLAAALKRGAKSLGLGSVLEEHFKELSFEERRFLEILAVAGRPLQRSYAISAANVSGNEHAIESDLRIGQLIKSSGPTENDLLETYHDRVRESLVASLNESQLCTYHLELARTLTHHTPEDHENLARHFREGGELTKAADHYLKAAKDSRQALAFEHTAGLYRAALECGPGEGTNLAGIHAAMGDALANAGRGLEAASEFHNAARITNDTEKVLDFRRREAHQHMISGHFDEGLRVIKEVLEQAGISFPPTHAHALFSAGAQSLVVRLLGIPQKVTRGKRGVNREIADKIDTYWVTASGLGTIDVFRAADFHLRALRLSLRSGDPARIARSLSLHAIYNGARGSRTWKETKRLLEIADWYSTEAGDEYSKAVFEMAKSGTFMLAGRFSNSVKASETAELRFREHGTGVAWEIDTVQVYRTSSLLSLGELNCLRDTIYRLAESAEDRGDKYSTTNFRAWVIPVLMTYGDDPEGALKVRQAAIDGWSKEGFYAQHTFGMVSYGEAQLYLGRPKRVLTFFERQWPKYKGALYHRIQFGHQLIVSLRARASIMAWIQHGDRKHLDNAIRDSRILERENTNYGDALSLSIRGGVAMALGSRQKAVEYLHRSCFLFEKSQMAIHAAATKQVLAMIDKNPQTEQFVFEATDYWEREAIPNPSRVQRSLIPIPIIKE